MTDGSPPESGQVEPGPDQPTGRVLSGRYSLGRAIGTGASGTVYAAHDLGMGRHVAVKVLHEALAGDPVFVERLGVEARIAAGLQHPNILTVYDWGVDGSAYLVTEYLAGGSLRSLLDTGRTLSHSQALVVGLEVCKALDHAHQMGVVHRDLKPANLLFNQDGHLKVSDFGLASALAETSRTDIFVEGIVGTARFASPEQAKGQPLDGRSDVYALALVLVESVTGHLPFVEDTLLGTLRARRRRDVPVPASMGPIGPAVARAGVVDANRRPAAGELGRLLLDASAGLLRPEPLPLVGPGEIGAAPLSGEVPVVPKTKAPAESRPEKVVGPNRRAPWALVAVLMVVVAVLGGAALWQASQESTTRVPLLLGADEEEATTMIEDAGWLVEPRYERRDGTRQGQVLATDPAFGVQLEEGGTIVLVVSLGSTRVAVPAGLVGLSLGEATRLLEAADLTAGTVAEVHDDEVEAGMVLQVAAIATELPRGAGVDLIVSAGAAPRTVPVGLVEGSAEEAVAALTALGLAPALVEAHDESMEVGAVVSLNPAPDEEVPLGSDIEVIVSIGPAPRPVPDVVGLGLVAAEERLATAGFRVIEVVGPTEGATIASQAPPAYEELSPAERVVLVLEGGELPIQEPEDDVSENSGDPVD
ncbi:MAG: protein kinase [Actinomycetota bacterium]|nr:protein kinase [Actinomycetota bacterium]